MKIAYIYYEDIRNSIRTSGANIVQTLSSCNALSKESEVHFYHGWVSKKTIRNCFDKMKIGHGFKLVKLPVFPLVYFPVVEQLGRLIFFLQVALKIRKGDFDLIYTRDYSFLYFLNIFKFLKPKAPIFYEAHKVYHIASRKVSSSAREVECINRNCSHVFTTTDYIAEELRSLGVTTFMTTLRNGVDLNLFKSKLSKVEALKELNLPTDKFIALYIGSFIDWKGVDVLLGAAELSKNSDILFIAAGGSQKELEVYSRKLGKFENVRIQGNQARGAVAKLMAAADVGVIPVIITASGMGQWYTCPMKMAEYMAAGLPIIASDLPSIRNFLNPENALFFTQGNSSDLLRRIEELRAKPELALSMKQKNLEKVKASTFENRSHIILSNYRKLKSQAKETVLSQSFKF